MTTERLMESLGWQFMPTGPNEWEWLKFSGDECIARQGDAVWEGDLAECAQQNA